MKNSLLRADELLRRDFIVRTASALLGVGLLPTAFGDSARADDTQFTPARASATARNIIYLYMDGGMSHVDTLDPKEGAEIAGPVKPLKSSADGIVLTEYLKRTAQQMHLGTLVRSLTSTQGAHEQGNYFMHTSYQLRGTILHPCLGAWLSVLQGGGNQTLPRSVYIGAASRHPGAGFFDATHQPLFVNNPENGLANIRLPKGLTDERLRARLQLASELDAQFHARFPQRQVKAYDEMYDQAVVMMKSKDIAAFDLTTEQAELRKAYGQNPFGQGCLLARRLVERGVRFVEVSLKGWDTHTANFVRTPELCAQLDAGLATLVADLQSRGMLKDTLVVLATEFGRTPVINSSSGRDHYPKAFSCALFGGGAKAGQLYGRTNKTATEVEEHAISIPDFNASLAYALGLPLEKTVTSPNGRPFTVADKGKPVVELFT